MSLSYTLYRLTGMVAPTIPPKVGYGLCRIGGGLLYQLNKSARHNIGRNLRYILGPQTSEAEIRRRTRATFNHILYNYFDLFRLPHLDGPTVSRLVTIDGWENIEAGLVNGRGLIMTSTHLGNIEIVLYEMLRRGLPITIPVERVEPPELFDYISALRMSKGLKLVPIDGTLLELARTLRRGGVAGLAGDRDITGTGQVVPFFGQPAHLPDGHVRLALKTGVPLVIGFSRRNPDHSHTAYFLPPFYVPATGTKEERITAGLNVIVSEMEKGIRQVPEQWTLTVSIWADGAAS